ncbi:MAG TPA: aldo/keto reductase [Candidatus Dormibacteraeota bacterium]|nr:aldo/keto reductase [Candidatus Dormibacteraeota bacterium]
MQASRHSPAKPASAAGTLVLGDRVVNRVGFGAMRLCGPGVWGPPADPQNAVAVVRRAVQLGVTFIDTADSYGPDVSEELIAQALHPYPADVVVATKGGLTRGGPGEWARDCRPERLKSCLEGSLRRLRLDCIELYQLHAVDPNVPWEDQVGVLAEMRAAGKIRQVGLSNVDVEHLEAARRIVPVVSVQNRYNVGDRASEPVLTYCAQHGLAFIPWFPLDAGDVRKHEGIDAIARAHGASAYDVALAWLLHHAPVTLPIPGTQSLQHLEENVAVAALRLTDEEYAALDRSAA